MTPRRPLCSGGRRESPSSTPHSRALLPITTASLSRAGPGIRKRRGRSRRLLNLSRGISLATGSLKIWKTSGREPGGGSRKKQIRISTAPPGNLPSNSSGRKSSRLFPSIPMTPRKWPYGSATLKDLSASRRTGTPCPQATSPIS